MERRGGEVMSYSKKQPKFKLPKTRGERMWNVIGYSIFFGTLIFIIFIWRDIPDRIPAHYNAAGDITRWGSKWELLILLIPGVFTAIFMGIAEKHPESHNYPKRFNEANAKKFYLNSRKMINQLKNICMIIFAFLALESVFIALDWWDGLGNWTLPVLVISALMPIFLGLIKRKNIE